MIDVKLLYPIGSIYMSIQDTNPSVFFGGTWERIAKGKTLVGVDENDSDFNTSSKTGGEKTHQLTVDELPKHQHRLTILGGGNISASGVNWNSNDNCRYYSGDMIEAVGGNRPHNNMQPYYTCYIFVRTA